MSVRSANNRIVTALRDEAGSALDPALVELVLAEPGRWLLP